METHNQVTPTERVRRYREKWLAEGKCINCGKQERAFLSLECQTCLDAHKRRGKRHRAKLAIERIRKRHAWFHPQKAKREFQQREAAKTPKTPKTQPAT
jgi:hypothetical protein